MSWINQINPLYTQFDCHYWFLIHRAMFHLYINAYHHCFRSHTIRKDDSNIRTLIFAFDSWVNFINVLFAFIHLHLAFCSRINSQITLSPLMPNQTISLITPISSQFTNRTPIILIGPLLINTNTTKATTQQTTIYNNISTKSNPYKTLITCLLLFYTIIFEKYSRR